MASFLWSVDHGKMWSICFMRITWKVSLKCRTLVTACKIAVFQLKVIECVGFQCHPKCYSWHCTTCRSDDVMKTGHVTYLTINALTFIDVCLAVDTSISRHTLAAVTVNNILTAATILTYWTVVNVWTHTIIVAI